MKSRPIQQLSPSLVNRIAAGEVIERPASVVKELVENALDAGALNIVVEIEDGGRELIRVIDDGGGIPAAQLPLAFAEHATSKLDCDEDLFRISTMGFRGEALASIGSVSQARIISRTAESDAGYEILNRGGAISIPQASAANIGTTVEVRNLFFNTPARRKFLKGSSTESGHISEMLLRLALPYPQVRFTLSNNGKSVIELASSCEEERWLAAWPREFHEHRMMIESREAEVSLRGLIGAPELARPTGRYQYLYLNGRHIKDRFILHAAREAYRGLTEPGRFPAAILLLDLPPQDVDVNVHPTKVEVRFRDSARIHNLVMAVLRRKLLGSDLTPHAIAFGSSEDGVRQDMRTRLAGFFKQLPGSFSQEDGVLPAAPQPFFLPPAPLQMAIVPAPTPVVAPMVDSQPESLPPLRGSAAIQLHNSYLVVETIEGMIIIDQHALHERIMYEDLRKRLLRGPLESQRLLLPAIVTASPRQLSLLGQIQPVLQRLGIEIGEFGPGTIAVQSFPSFLERLDPVEFVRELLERGEQELLDLHEEELLHELLDMMACKAAVKAGDPLSQGEIEALLARRDLVDRASNCPHGRPTTLRLTLKELAKQFKRTGF